MRMFLLVTALLAVVAFGVAEGRWTNRWSSSRALEKAAARLADVPATIGDWVSSDQALDPRQVAQAEMEGYLQRRYVHRSSGASLSVLLVCGRPGPTAVHTPDICLPASGYNQAGAPQRQRINVPGDAAAAEFWSARFQKSSDTAEPFQVYWSWNAAGEWVASDHPRFQFGRYPFLYKLYVTRPVVVTEDSHTADQRAEFLAAFLPEVHRVLFIEQ
jgi:hypothetical protein